MSTEPTTPELEAGNPVFVDNGREGRVTSVHDGYVWVSIKDPTVNTGWRIANGYYPSDVQPGRMPEVGDQYRFTNDVVEIIEVFPALDFYDRRPAVRYAWLTEIDVDPAIREHSTREAGRLTGLSRADTFVRTATFVEAGGTEAESIDPLFPSLTESGDEPDPVGALTAPAGVELTPPPTMTPQDREALAASFAQAANRHPAVLSHDGVTVEPAIRPEMWVVYAVDGPTAYLRGVHGKVLVTYPAGRFGDTVADVVFKGHTATWAIPVKHLAPLALELHEPGCDCPPHVAATVAAVAADRAARGVPSLVQLDRDEAVQEALVALGDAAIAWHDADPDQPAGIAAEAALSDAITTFRKAAGR